MDSADVSVKCKNCGNEAKAGSYVLSSEHGMMVCPDCMRKSGGKKEPSQEKEQVTEAKPAGWDSEDEMLERLHRQKQATKPKRPHLEEGMKIKCRKCNYVFIYKKKFNECPYCDSPF